jgi:murein DD-endopeptidase
MWYQWKTTEHNRRFAMHATTRICSIALVLLIAGLLGGCGSAPVREAPARQISTGAAYRAVQIARHQLGAPYRYGGDTPRGFDCSGLVYYAYHRAGIDVPRTTRQQLRYARPVAMSRLEPGDLLFFRVSRRKPSHVGIYVGHDRFIHAPSSGKRVSYASLDNPYWSERIVAAGRF